MLKIPDPIELNHEAKVVVDPITSEKALVVAIGRGNDRMHLVLPEKYVKEMFAKVHVPGDHL